MQRRIELYAGLSEYVDAFYRGVFDVMIVEGTPGNGKSTMVKEQFAKLNKVKDKDFLWLEGRMTAASFYDQLYNHRDLPVILDDVDGLYSNKECVNILKCLCQTEVEKSISWNTITKMDQGRSNFITKSKVLIITNSWKSLNRHVGAVEDRGLLILFHPPAEEIHIYVKEKLGEAMDKDVYDFIGRYLPIIAKPSIRNYRNAHSMKVGGLDWKETLIESFGLTDNEMLVLKLHQKDLSCNKRAIEFAEISKKSDRTYWRTKADLEARGINLGGD